MRKFVIKFVALLGVFAGGWECKSLLEEVEKGKKIQMMNSFSRIRFDMEKEIFLKRDMDLLMRYVRESNEVMRSMMFETEKVRWDHYWEFCSSWGEWLDEIREMRLDETPSNMSH